LSELLQQSTKVPRAHVEPGVRLVIRGMPSRGLLDVRLGGVLPFVSGARVVRSNDVPGKALHTWWR